MSGLNLDKVRLGSERGTATFLRGSATGSATLITYLVPAGKTFQIDQWEASCRKPGKFTILDGATLISTGRTGAGVKNIERNFKPAEPISGGTTLTVSFVQNDGGTNSDVEVFIRGRLI